MAASIPPFQLTSKLHGNPERPPIWSVDAKRADGTTMKISDPKAVRAMIALMDMQAQFGGAASHWGGPSAFAELMASLHGLMFLEAQTHRMPWHQRFNFVNDAGHCENGLYALRCNYGVADLNLEKLRGFRSIKSPLTGHGEAHLFPEGVLISNGPLGSALPQAQGLAMADKLSGRERLTVCAISDGACMEGEAREALAAIPGFAARNQLAPFVLIISDNNTKLSGRIDQQSFSMAPSFSALAQMGWTVLHLENGNDLIASMLSVEYALAKAWADPTKAIALHARTIKGFGVKKTAESASGGHGFPCKNSAELKEFLKELYGSAEIPTEFMSWCEELAELEKQKSEVKPATVKTEKVQAGVSRALNRKRKEGLPIVSITSDLPGSTGVADFQSTYPELSFDVGVAEANMISVAAGFSRSGYIPIVDTFAQFAVTKGALPLTMAQLSLAPVISILSHAGFQDAADGASHQALTYLAMVSAIPNTKVFILSCSDEADSLVGQAVEEFYRARKTGAIPPHYIFFLGRENFPVSYSANSKYELGKAQVVLDTTELKNPVTIVAAGPMLPLALQAAQEMKLKNQGAIVINPSIINLVDVETIRDALDQTEGRLITVEDHQLSCGMGAQMCHALLQSNAKFTVRSLGVDGVFGQSAYAAKELYEKHGLNAQAIQSAAIHFL